METRLYKQVAEKIQAMIAAEGYRNGDRLPSERELSAKLAVSRASLREGLIALELTGVVEVRSNSGVYLSERPGPSPTLPETGPGPFEVLSARRVIESEIAAIAAQVATDRAIDAILVAVEAMERNHDDVATNELADRNFHMAIANATGNSALVGVMNHLWDQRGHLWHRLKEHFQTEELRKETLGDHRAILQAIASHDPAAARKAMRVHLGRVTRTFSA
ncbi:MAG: FadR family transcriptional regulator [Pseudoduganella sp.]|nr:FadR family transcriptional regulator [Pseudoduganella sp.]